MSKPSNKEQEQTAVSKKKPVEVDSKKTSIKSPPNDLTKDCNPDELSKKTATSLILFEEVDVIFDDDLGFLSAIKTFMTTTKRPVILTTSDPAFSAMFDGDFEEIVFEPPSVVDVASYLQLLCLAEDMRTDLKDVSALLSLNSCDVRKTLLQLQFWTRSGGGRQLLTPPAEEEKAEGAVAVLANCEMKDPAPLPFCDTGCTESMLGLLSVAPQQNIWDLLKKREEDCSKVVTMSRRQGVDLLYANMEALLPLPVTTITMANHKQQRPLPPAPDQPSENPAQSQELPSHAKLLHAQYDFSDDASPVKVSNRMKKNRRRRCPPEQGTLQSDSDSEDGFLSIKQQSSQVKKNVTLMPMKVMKKPLSREELVKSVPVLQCLRSMADFMDDMSFVDLLSNEECNIKDMSGAAVVKDGLTDEARLDTEKRRSGPLPECASEISAQVQSLGFSKCCSSVSEAWLKVQQLDAELREEAERELTLPVASHYEGCTFTQQGLCHPQVVKQRRAVMDDLEVKGVFGPMGNRPAAAQDYLPTLRTICKSERLKEQGKVKRRFLHYLDAIHLGLKKSTLERLSEDYP
uniref:ATPase family AAA domain-containing protein 5 n=1 Tax=Neogobius melanostomus TaxID=47308 RepID=A0A8C6U5X6_9GOBI